MNFLRNFLKNRFFHSSEKDRATDAILLLVVVVLIVVYKINQVG